MKPKLMLALLFLMSGPALAQDAPAYEENGQAILARMSKDQKLTSLMKILLVAFDYSEQKTIDGQPHKIAHYKVVFIPYRPACSIVKNNLGITITSDRSLCQFPAWSPGEAHELSLTSSWKQTDQGWRLVSQQVLWSFPP